MLETVNKTKVNPVI